jgi:hypothetical protein
MKEFLGYDCDSFNRAYAGLKYKWDIFLKERNEHNEYKHSRLSGASFSLKKNMLYLFTYKAFKDLEIPNTTNSCDKYFTLFKKRINSA